MRRVFGAALLFALASCGGGDDGTYVVMRFEQMGNLGGTVHRVHVHATLAGRGDAADVDFNVPAGKQLPLSGALEIVKGAGAISVTATAFDTAGQMLGEVMLTGTVNRGQLLQLDFCFGDGCPLRPDASVPDGGPDGGDDGGTPAKLEVTPTAQDFGSVVDNTTSTEATFTLTNTGQAPTQNLQVQKTGTDKAEFAISDNGCTGPLAMGGTCTVTVIFTPRTPGDKTASLDFTATGTSVSASLAGKGLPPGDLVFSPNSQGFPDTLAGAMSSEATLTVRNTGLTTTGTLTTMLSPTTTEFAITQAGCAAPLGPSASCTIKVRFQPQTAGAKTASLVVSDATGGSATAGLTGLGLDAPSLTILPGSQDFGPATIGNQTGTVDFTVRNAGGVTSSVPSVLLSDLVSFNLVTHTCTSALAPGGTCKVSVRFTPSAPAGSKTAMLTVSATQGGSATATLTGMAIPMGSLAIAPSTPQAFGSVGIGSSSSETTFTITNTGGSATGLPMVALSGADPGSFMISSNTCTAVLAAADTCTVGVTFVPGAVGPRSATLSITAVPGGQLAASLSGTGTAQLTVVKAGSGGGTVTSTSSPGITCGSTCSASFSATTVTLAATADGVSDLTSWSGGGCSGTGSCIVPMTMAQTVTATFTPKPLGLSLSPSTQDFGSVTVGNNSSITFTVTNTGGVASGTITSAVNDANYTVTGGTCGATLAANATCTLIVRFNPTSAGAKPAMLTATGSAGGMTTASLTGSGLTAGQLTMTPGSKDFGQVALGSMSAETQFTITNTGGSASGTLSAPSLSDANFVISSNTCSGSLAASSSCVIGVKLAPSSVGLKQGVSLSVTASPGGTIASTLQGTGTASITVTKAGLGTVTSTPSGISCGATCTATFSASPVILNVVADPGYSFSGWSGACAGTGACSVTLDAASKTATATFTAIPTTDLRVAGSDAPDPVSNGQQITYTLTVTNAGPSAATGVTLTDTISASTTYVSATSTVGTCTRAGSTITCNVGALASAGTATITIKVTGSVNGTATNSASVTGVESDPDTTNNAATLTTTINTAANVGITSISDAPDPVNLGANITYTIALRNAGPNTASNTTMTDTLPASLTYVSATSTLGSCSRSLQVVTCAIGSMSNGATPTVTIVATATTSGLVTNSASLSSTVTDPDNSDNTKSTTTTVNPGFLLSVTKSGTGTGTVTSDIGGISCGATCSASYSSGTVVTLTATPTGSSVFTGWSGACTGTSTCVVTVSAAATATATFAPSFTYTVNVFQNGSVTSSPAGISCPGTCSASFASGTVVTLTAKAGGIPNIFRSWSGDCSGTLRTCPLTANVAHNLSATFGTETGNLVFLSSSPFAANLGGALAYDTQCNTLATAAGINNGTNDGYVAWMSDASSTAPIRIGTGRGFVRTDGQAFADTIAALTGSNKIFNTIIVDENNKVVNGVQVFTGTAPDGTASASCTNWTSMATTATSGENSRGPREWTSTGGTGASSCASTKRIYCFGKTKNVAINPTVTSGKKIYVSNAFSVGGGVSAANTACNANRPAGVASARALLPTFSPSVPLSSLLVSGTSYVRPDGQLIGTGAEMVAGTLHSGPWQRWDGSYINDTPLNGSVFPITAAPTSASTTCNDWTVNTTMSVSTGLTTSTSIQWALGGGWDCSETPGLFCAEL